MFTRSKLTRDYLKKLYIDEQIRVRKNSVNKIIDHLSENVIKKAIQGETMFAEHFPKNKLSELIDDVIEELTKIFPDSIITCSEDKLIDSMKSTEITIDWTIQNV